MLFEGGKVLVDVGVDAQIDDFEAGALEHHAHQVLADVVDVALDGADHDLADRFGAGLGEQRSQNGHAGLHRIGGKEHLGHEEDAVSEVDAHDAHALDERVIEDAICVPASAEQDVGAFFDLLAEAVVQIVVHLGGQVFVAQRVEIDLVVVRHVGSPELKGRSRRPVKHDRCGSSRALSDRETVPHRGIVPYHGTGAERKRCGALFGEC